MHSLIYPHVVYYQLTYSSADVRNQMIFVLIFIRQEAPQVKMLHDIRCMQPCKMSMHCHRKAPNDTIYKIYFKAKPPSFQLLDGMTNCDSSASSSSTFPIVATASHRNPSPTLKTAESATSQVYVSQPCSITHDSKDTWTFLFRNQQLSLFRIKTHKTTDSRRS